MDSPWPVHGSIERDELELLRSTLPSFTNLQDVVRWAFALAPPSDVDDVVIQDEFTHDVVIPWRKLWLVFDTT